MGGRGYFGVSSDGCFARSVTGGFTTAEPLSAVFPGTGAFGAFSFPAAALSFASFQMEVCFGAVSFAGAAFFLSAGASACVSFGGRPLRLGGSIVLSGSFFTAFSGFEGTFPFSGEGAAFSGAEAAFSGCFPFSAACFPAMISEKL